MRILGLDLGTITGWAVDTCEPDGAVSGTWDLSPQRAESRGFRYIRLRALLNACRDAFPDLKLVCFEQAHHRDSHTTEIAYGLAATVQTWAAEIGIEVAPPLHSATIKKFAAGSGRASKEDVIAAARKRWHLTSSGAACADEADALWLLAWAKEKWAREPARGGRGVRNERVSV